MMHEMKFQIILVLNVLLYLSVNAIVVENVSSATFDGVGFYISVKREAIQKKLDLFHTSVYSECSEGPKLFLPRTEVLPVLHDNDQHPVYLDVGFLTSHDFDQYLADNPDPCIAFNGLEVAVTIPFLSDTPSGPPVYALALAILYEKSRGDFPKTNALFPYIPVDEIKMNNFGAVVKNGSDEMRLSFNRQNHPCKPPNSIVGKEFEDQILNEFQFGRPEPDFSFCNGHPIKSDYCDKAASVRCSAHQNVPNICQLWKSENYTLCITTVEIQNITLGFREFILVGEDPINILASESLSGDFTIGLKYPCQE